MFWKLFWSVAAIVSTLTLAAPFAAQARTEKQECKGILNNAKKDGDDLLFNVPPEGVCEIKSSETSKVMAQCTIGNFCRVYGVVGDCKDSGECAEITKVLKVTHHQSPTAKPYYLACAGTLINNHGLRLRPFTQSIVNFQKGTTKPLYQDARCNAELPKSVLETCKLDGYCNIEGTIVQHSKLQWRWDHVSKAEFWEGD